LSWPAFAERLSWPVFAQRLWPSGPTWWLLALREWRHHPWRHGAALVAVALGVALAFSVHLINTSALAEFSQAVRSANGQPDLTLRGSNFDDALYERVARDPAVQLASPVLEIDTYAVLADADKSNDAKRVAVRVLGLDAMLAAPLAPSLLPKATVADDRLAFMDPDVVFPNLALMQALKQPTGTLQLQAGLRYASLRVAGSVAASGGPLIVMDLAGAQHHFGLTGRLSRIDLRLAPGADIGALVQRLQLPPGVSAAAPDAAEQRVSSLSRAYRVNLTVLALVALFVGAFLVFSVVSLSVAQRTPAFALLGTLGLSAAERRQWVLAECAVLGVVGSSIGLLLGVALAAAALRLLAGDLGGGYFPGITPTLLIEPWGTAAFAVLGLLSALAGGWWPARQALQLAPAQALKGHGVLTQHTPTAWPALALLALGTAAAFAPPLAGLPLAAYAAVAALLFGGVGLVPAVVHLLLARAGQAKGALLLLALQRARFQRQTATAAVAGVVASLALSVALTVMVASFRTGVSDWLGDVLPADLYARSASSTSASNQAWLPPGFVQQAAQVAGVQRVQASRSTSLNLVNDSKDGNDSRKSDKPSVVLVSRELAAPENALPLLRAPLPVQALQPGEVAVYVSEAVVSLYGAEQGQRLLLPLPGQVEPVPARVLGVWRDYARQFGAITMADSDYQRLTGDTRINDLALWLGPGADAAAVQGALRALLPDPAMLEFMSSADLRRLSLRIFDRSFAVTYYLQALAVVIGLLGIAASLSAQVLARRKEFGLLVHLGLTRRQIVAVVAGEGAAWVAAGTCIGLLLGLAISMVLVWVVNPQSFHWTMGLVLPATRLALLCGAVMVAGTLTSAWAARHAATRQAVLSVKEDW
jgi:putative ABC transport system permease protein